MKKESKETEGIWKTAKSEHVEENCHRMRRKAKSRALQKRISNDTGKTQGIKNSNEADGYVRGDFSASARQQNVRISVSNRRNTQAS
jgi:hypothetical protein